MYPSFEITNIETANGTISLLGSIDRTTQGKETWVADGAIGALLQDRKVAFGRWHKDSEWGRFQFDEGEKDKLKLNVGGHLAVLDGYWGERAELVYNVSITWMPITFKPNEKSDHEHCAILWETISDRENTIYYLGNARHPVCADCYQKYINNKDISFIPST